MLCAAPAYLTKLFGEERKPLDTVHRYRLDSWCKQVNFMQCFGLALAVGAMIFNFVDKGKKKGGKGAKVVDNPFASRLHQLRI